MVNVVIGPELSCDPSYFTVPWVATIKYFDEILITSDVELTGGKHFTENNSQFSVEKVENQIFIINSLSSNICLLRKSKH